MNSTPRVDKVHQIAAVGDLLRDHAIEHGPPARLLGACRGAHPAVDAGHPGRHVAVGHDPAAQGAQADAAGPLITFAGPSCCRGVGFARREQIDGVVEGQPHVGVHALDVQRALLRRGQREEHVAAEVHVVRVVRRRAHEVFVVRALARRDRLDVRHERPRPEPVPREPDGGVERAWCSGTRGWPPRRAPRPSASVGRELGARPAATRSPRRRRRCPAPASNWNRRRTSWLTLNGTSSGGHVPPTSASAVTPLSCSSFRRATSARG